MDHAALLGLGYLDMAGMQQIFALEDVGEGPADILIGVTGGGGAGDDAGGDAAVGNSGVGVGGGGDGAKTGGGDAGASDDIVCS